MTEGIRLGECQPFCPMEGPLFGRGYKPFARQGILQHGASLGARPRQCACISDRTSEAVRAVRAVRAIFRGGT